MVGRKASLAIVEYSMLESATDKFSESNILGQGGFGFVYRACFDEGVVAAVKKLEGGRQDCNREFEVDFHEIAVLEYLCKLLYCVGHFNY